MTPEAYNLKLGKQFVVIIQTANFSRLEDISKKLREFSASSILSNVFSLRLDGEDVASSIEKVAANINGALGTGDTVLFIYGDGNGLSGKFVLIREEKSGEGIRVAVDKYPPLSG